MKKITAFLLASFIAAGSHAQLAQQSGQINLTSFTKETPKITNELNAQTNDEFKKHPEYGIVPFNAPCKDCFEVLQKRDERHRYFLKEGSNGGEFYAQTSYSKMSYKDVNGYMRTIDYRLRPTLQSNIFSADRQPFPVTVNLQDKYISILNGGKEIQINRNVSLFIQNANGTLVSLGEPSWTNYSAGDDGVIIYNFYPGIDLEMRLGEGKVETFYRINKPLNLNGGSLVIRDNVQLPQGFVYDYSYSEKKDGLYQGALCVNSPRGTRYFIIGNPAAIDENGSENDRLIGLQYAIGNSGNYDLYIPLSWMNNPGRSYPILIDPFVTGSDTLPQNSITGSGYSVDGPACDSKPFTNGCTYNLGLVVPAGCTVTDMTYSFNYRALGTCNLNQGGWDLTSGNCRSPITSGTYHTCSIGLPGLCILQNLSMYSDVKSCIRPPQCASYTMPFTLTFYRCVQPGTGCGFSCVTADTPWDMTVKGYKMNAYTKSTSICRGSSATLSASADSGVTSSYTYRWFPGNLTGQSVNVSPSTTTTYTVYASDCSGIDSASAISKVTVLPNDNPGFTISPNPDCSGAPITITGNAGISKYGWLSPGGNPSSKNNAQSYTVSYANTGTYSITLIDSSGECVFDSTLQVTVSNLKVAITAGGLTTLCQGDSVILTASGAAKYIWNNGATTTSITAKSNQTFYVVGTSGNGCSGISNTITVVVNRLPAIAIVPKSASVCQGDSVQLCATGGISYMWNPGNITGSCITTSSQGHYTVTGSNSSGCKASAGIDVTVNPLPIVTITGGPTSFCAGDSATFAAHGANKYKWSNGDTTSVITIGKDGVYSVTGTDVNGCSGSSAIEVASNVCGLTLTKTPSQCTVAKGVATQITFTYVVTNNDNTYSASGKIVDDNGTPGNTSDDITVCNWGPIAPGGNATCTHVFTISDTYTNVAIASGITTAGHAVSDTATAKVEGISCSCNLSYPDSSNLPRSAVVFNESTVLVASDPGPMTCGTTGSIIKLWYSDEHAMTLGVRSVIIKHPNGKTDTTKYAITPTPLNPTCVYNPLVGDTISIGGKSGDDVAAGGGRPLWPAIFITDLTVNGGSSRIGDWQQGGIGVSPTMICGTWKGALRYVDSTKNTVTVTPDADPAKNTWSGITDVPPGGFASYTNQGYGAECAWNVDSLNLIPGHSYRLEFMVHDGDQNKAGGDAGENCTTIYVPDSGCSGHRMANPDVNNNINGALAQASQYGIISVAYPNPFSSSTTIQYSFTEDKNAVTIDVFSMNGEKVASLLNGNASAGQVYNITFNAEKLTGGIYIYRINADNNFYYGKLILMK